MAYCDESYSGDLKRTPLYVLAGFCGPYERWSMFYDYWRATMRELRIESLGVHASKCANGAGPYQGMTSERRRELQYRLIVDIAASKPLMGFVAVVDTTGFNEHAERIRLDLGRDDAKYHVPHVMAMEICVELIAQVVEDVVQDRITFIFDQNKEFGGRAAKWHQMTRSRPLARHHLKLGELFHASRDSALGLQAADLLAYAAFRHYSDSTRNCWQWEALLRATRIVTFRADADFWDDRIDPEAFHASRH